MNFVAFDDRLHVLATNRLPLTAFDHKALAQVARGETVFPQRITVQLGPTAIVLRQIGERLQITKNFHLMGKCRQAVN